MTNLEIRTYKLKDLVQHNPELEALGIEMYFLEGWELFLFILQNYEALIDPEVDFGPWFGACHVGISRSKDLNEFLEQLNIPTGKKIYSNKEEPSAGIEYFQLSILAAGGTVKDGIITPEKFER